jgi:transcriptional regulator with XRE-family HTH domain
MAGFPPVNWLECAVELTFEHKTGCTIGKGGPRMKILSAVKLSQTVSDLRTKKKLTQAELGERTGLHRIMIGRIEREDFTPSIVQLQALADVLGFEITDMFEEKGQSQSFIALRSESMNEVEQKGVDTLLGMMFALRQQILLRRKFEHASKN